MGVVGCGDDADNGATGGTAGGGGMAGSGGMGGSIVAVCGNGSVEGTEACDDMGESATCDDDCTLAECGDGVLNVTAGEECDDGNTADGDGCESDCLLPPAALFNGTYFYQAFAGNFSVPSGYSWWGNLTADGVSEITGGTLGWNDGAGGIFSGPAPAIPYALDAARRMIWSAGGAFNLEGGIAIDGSVATMSSIGLTAWPGLTILVRREGTFDLGSLTDTYHVSGFCSSAAGDVSFWGSTIFDGLGGANQTFSQNTNGSLSGPFPSMPETYTVAADGTTTYTLVSVAPQQGGILLGGDLVVLTGSTTAAPAITCLVVLIRQSTAASASTLSGNYHIGALFADAPPAPPPDFSSFTGTGSSDGVGTLTTNVGGTINVDGVVTTWPPAVTNESYTVSANGTLTLTTAGTTLVGGVSPTGDYAVVSGGTTMGSLPRLWFLVR